MNKVIKIIVSLVIALVLLVSISGFYASGYIENEARTVSSDHPEFHRRHEFMKLAADIRLASIVATVVAAVSGASLYWFGN